MDREKYLKDTSGIQRIRTIELLDEIERLTEVNKARHVLTKAQGKSIERLKIENKELEYLLDCRAGKLLKKDKYFIVVAIDEDYFPVVYRMIKVNEIKKGRWTVYDESNMQRALKER